MRALILGFASMAAVGVCQAPAALLAQERPPIIDMHLHADLPAHDVPEATEQAPFLTEEQKRDILYHNAVRFLRLVQDASRARPSKEE